jgi:hypothetical protein
LLFQTIATRLLKRYWPSIFHRAPKQITGGVKYSPVAQQDGPDSEGAKAAAVQIEMPEQALEQDQTAKEVPSHIDNISSEVYYRKLVPIGVLFAASLVLSNLVYRAFCFEKDKRVSISLSVYLSVSTIQMIKSGSPIAVMLASFAFGLREPSVRLISIILVICFGTGLACTGALDFQLFGFGIQATAIAVEATRLALIQTLLHGVGMSPLQSLYAFARESIGLRMLSC